ncbi:MAG: sigma-70 family RNA polymerase sigma factor [Lachnospiraceae bacterium]|nr:sigma-70 family RNA polymerase sigma factor [Lachnospiraceae bacterium]
MAGKDPPEMNILSELYREQRSRLLGTAFGILQNRHDAEDAVQDVFLKLLPRTELLRNMAPEKRKSFLTCCVMNRARDLLRQRTQRSEVELKEEWSEDLPDPFWQRDAEQTEAAEQLKDILGVLSEKEQRILIGHFAYGLSYRDLAALMDLTPAAVQKTVSRLRQRIKKSGKEAQA